jgi:hypothetical protein
MEQTANESYERIRDTQDAPSLSFHSLSCNRSLHFPKPLYPETPHQTLSRVRLLKYLRDKDGKDYDLHGVAAFGRRMKVKCNWSDVAGKIYATPGTLSTPP